MRKDGAPPHDVAFVYATEAEGARLVGGFYGWVIGLFSLGWLRGCIYKVVCWVASVVAGIAEGLPIGGRRRIDGIAWNAVRHAAAQYATSRRHHPIWCVEFVLIVGVGVTWVGLIVCVWYV